MPFIEFFAKEGAVIAQAPVTFAIATILIFGLAYAAASFRFGSKIAGLEAERGILSERIQLRDDRAAEYERKLQGASPDEAKAELEELKQKLAALVPPRLSPEQANKIVALASKSPAQMQVVFDSSGPYGDSLANDFLEAFGRAGWDASGINQMGSGGPPRIIAVLPHQSAAGSAATDALHAAGIDFDVQRADAITFGRQMPDLVLELRLPVHRP